VRRERSPDDGGGVDGDELAFGGRSPDHRALGQAVRAARAQRGLSQMDLAARSGMHRSYIGGIERGERSISYSNLLRVAAALGVDASELVAQAETLHRPDTPPA
jgi:transcriptional regulator with XRE-family HTH domain